ncbi:MAG: transposase [Xanthobacteraceae bacterium]
MVRYRSHSIEFKWQACSRVPGRRALKRLARRHDISRKLVRLWIARYEAGELAEESKRRANLWHELTVAKDV